METLKDLLQKQKIAGLHFLHLSKEETIETYTNIKEPFTYCLLSNSSRDSAWMLAAYTEDGVLTLQNDDYLPLKVRSA